MRVLLEMGAEPIGANEEFSAALGVSRAAELVVVSQAVLCDRDGVVLHTDFAVIVELGKARGVVGARIVGLLREKHVVFA